jgi:hypothetical protein
MGFTALELLSTRETVATETPACLETATMVLMNTSFGLKCKRYHY